QAALLNAESETGVTIMKMDVGLDTGDIISQLRTRISDEDTAPSLHDRLAKLGADLLGWTIPNYVSGKIRPIPQPTEGASYAGKIKKEDGLIDWTKPAREIWNRWRALLPWPGIFTHFDDVSQKHLLKIWELEMATFTGSAGEILQAD